MRVHRAALLALLIAAAPAISGCADFDLDKLDVLGLNKKKPLPGERHSVFPEGVPGVTQGIPPELMRGHEQAQVGAAVPLDNVAQQPAQGEQKPAAEAKPKPKPKPKKVASRPTRIKMTPQTEAQPAAQPAPAQAAQPAQAPAGGWPAPANTEASPWPAPVQSGTFSKQQ